MAELQPLRQIHQPEGYSAVITGAPLFMFHWHKDALRFLSQHRKYLIDRPVAIFALGPVHDPYDDQEWRDSRAQLDKELARFPWFKPVDIKIFGGKYDPSRLRFPLKLFAGLVPASDIRDWESIRKWEKELTTKFHKS